MSRKVLITKASGVEVPFSYQKLRNSLEHSGADKDTIDRIIREVEKHLYEGIPTGKIHKMAYALLRKSHKYHAARYKLKQAIMELGPSGFPFERYMAEVLKHHGFDVKVGQIVKGYCVNHEIDIVVRKGGKLFMAECKYHNQTGIICDVKIPLYIKARFDDIKDQGIDGEKFSQAWLVTNTRFSEDAISYGTCAGLHLVGWDFPENKGLKDQIDDKVLFPVTCLSSLTKYEKHKLLDKNIVLCKEVPGNIQLLMQMGIGPDRVNTILEEITDLLQEKAHK